MMGSNLVGRDDREWPDTIDEMVWAREFIRTFRGAEDLDEGSIASWFEDAIAAGRASAKEDSL